MTEIERRVAAVMATWDHFRGRPFAFGRVDCVKLCAWHLRQMGRRVTGIGRAGSYRTALSARRALVRAGFASLAEAVTAAGLIEIAPAAALPGDIMLTPSVDGMEALTIVAGNGMVIGFHDDALAAGIQRVRIVDVLAVRAFRA
ncbi:MAG: hypothetical protein FJ335_11245 [Sphingomonadales bacterium]|nr:hypothetical protein [Sphingomonadales bacterium]